MEPPAVEMDFGRDEKVLVFGIEDLCARERVEQAREERAH